VGSSIIWRQDQLWSPAPGIDLVVPRGIKAEIVRHDPPHHLAARFFEVIPGTSDPRIESFAREVEQLANVPLHTLDFGLEPSDAATGIVEPLGDTWGSGGAARGRHALPHAQRSPLKPNISWDQLAVHPPIGGRSIREWDQWLRTTYRIGDTVKLVTDSPVMAPGNSTMNVLMRDPDDPDDIPHLYRIPDGARFEVIGDNRFNGTFFLLPVRLLDARDRHGYQLPQVGWPAEVAAEFLEPLVDNWKTAQSRPRTRHRVPRSQRSPLKPNVSASIDRVVDQVNAMADRILEEGGRLPGLEKASRLGRASLSDNKYLRFAQIALSATGAPIAPLALVNIVRKAARGDEDAQETVEALAADAREELRDRTVTKVGAR
jgi:hypothetical protein